MPLSCHYRLSNASRMVLQRLEVRLDERIIVRHSRPRVGLLNTKVKQQLGHTGGHHRATTVRMNGELPRINPFTLASPTDQFPSDHLGFPSSDRPADHLATEDVEDGVQEVTNAFVGAVQLGVGSDRGAVLRLPSGRFPGPPSEPDVRVSTHPALHEFMPRARLVSFERPPMVWGFGCPGSGSG